jgi:hypothetical protein
MGRKQARRLRVKLSDLSSEAIEQITDKDLLEDAVSKHGRIKVSKASERTVGGIVFASKLEAKFYTILKQNIPEGHLHLQPEFQLQEGFRDVDGAAIRSITYKSDFLLGPERKNATDPVHPGNVVIDAKGHLTDVFRIKAKMFSYKYRTRLVLVKNIKTLQQVMDEYLNKIHRK